MDETTIFAPVASTIRLRRSNLSSSHPIYLPKYDVEHSLFNTPSKANHNQEKLS